MQAVYELEVIEGPATGKVFQLSGDHVTLGRNEDSGICLGDPSVSGKHAELRRDEAGYSIRDLGSRNGTIVNGQAIEAAVRLNRGDVIVVGDTRLFCRVAAAEASSPAPKPVLEPESPEETDEDPEPTPSASEGAEPEPVADEAEAGTEDAFVLDLAVLRAWLGRPKVATVVVLIILALLGCRSCSVLRDRPSDSYVFAPGQEGNLKCKACGSRFMGTLLKAPGRCKKCNRKTAYFICTCRMCGEEYLSDVPRGMGLCPKCAAKE